MIRGNYFYNSDLFLSTYKIFLLVAAINAYAISTGDIATGHTFIESIVGAVATAQTGSVAAGSLIDAAIRTFLGANCKKKESINNESICTYIVYIDISYQYP